MNSVLADAVLILHSGIAAFLVGGLAAIWIGGWRTWAWTRRPGFRRLHLFIFMGVAAQSVLGLECPLTLWEDTLRGAHLQSGFVQRWIGRLLYYELPPSVFTVAYVAAVMATLLGWWMYPTERRPEAR